MVMGQYKVPQDVEAEDKIIGFLTLKQFIYSVIGLAWLIVSFELFKTIIFVWVIVGIPIGGIFLLLGLYQRQGQPFEAYFIALVSYWFKPRKRIWIKENILEVFKIEQPKLAPQLIGQDPAKVRGQLERLAQIIDTRGWAIKQPEFQDPDMAPVIDLNNRLATNEVFSPSYSAPEVDVGMSDDMLDFTHNPTAQSLNVLIENSTRTIHQEALEKMRDQGASIAPTVAPPVVSEIAPITTTEMTVNPIADILKVAMDTDLKVSQVSQIAARATQPAPLVEGQVTSVRPEANPKT